jgi:multiple sugar transport system ATP-binding protein
VPAITFKGVSKSYGTNTVIKEFSATIPDKEFLVILGPSGCGKSTVLRMVAGLTDITTGELRFDETVVNNLSPKKRKIAFVFQSYALYPHMDVGSNIAFPLVMDNFRWWHHVPILGGFARRAILKRPDISDKINRVAEMLELTDYLKRRPKALSGGQRQRVALARSLVREPAAYLLDEPLSNLDAKLRSQMRGEISALYTRVKKTFIYVTHDQVEAMTMGTQIIVLNDGVIQQYGVPSEIYKKPANIFVAGFVGTPPMNLFPAEVTAGGLAISDAILPASLEIAARVRALGVAVIQLGIRAEKISLYTGGESANKGLAAYVATVEHLGSETIVGFRLGVAQGQLEAAMAAIHDLHYAKLTGDVPFTLGMPCYVAFDLSDAVWFDNNSGNRVDLPRVIDGVTNQMSKPV